MRAFHSLILSTLLFPSLCGLLAAERRVTSPDGAGGAVVLRNGNVLVGEVTAVSEGYDVAREGAVLRAPQSMVDFVAESLEEVYEWKRAGIDVDSFQDHLQLARWCLRYGLWPQAAREIIDARGIEPDHVELKHAERQLALRSLPGTATVVETGPVEDTDLPPSPNMDVAIEQVAETLRPPAVEQFVRRVQPVLVNNCTAVGCHRADGPAEYQLSRALLYDEANRQTTLGNLAATLEQVDRNEPRNSPLLQMSVTAHGGSEEPPLAGQRHDLYQQIAQWVELVAYTPSKPAAVEPVVVMPQRVPQAAGRPRVKRGAFGANHPRAQGRHGAPNVQFGLRLRKVEEPPPDAAEK